MTQVLDKVLRIGILYDFYGALLTEKQRYCLEMHYFNDLSLAEIAVEYNVSRQAVHDILRRAEQTLEDYECKLGLVARHERDKKIAHEVFTLLNRLDNKLLSQYPEFGIALNKIRQILE